MFLNRSNQASLALAHSLVDAAKNPIQECKRQVDECIDEREEHRPQPERASHHIHVDEKHNGICSVSQHVAQCHRFPIVKSEPIDECDAAGPTV